MIRVASRPEALPGPRLHSTPTSTLIMSLATQLDLFASLSTRAEVEAAITIAREGLASPQSILELDSIWNHRLSLIASLPEDALLRILIEAVSTESPDANIQAKIERSAWIDWVKFSSVCKHWWVVTLGYPAF